MRTSTGKEAGNMKYYIYTTVKDRDGKILADSPDTDFITALDYIRADGLQEVEYRTEDSRPDTAKLIFSGKSKGRTIEATITEAEENTLPGVHLYDIATRIFWHNKEMTKGQDISFIELLGFIRVNQYKGIEKTPGNRTVNGLTFYSCFAGRENRRNRIEATVTKIED